VPDLVVARDLSDITLRGIEGPPLLAVEILSPSTRHADLRLKYDRCAELEIEHYWIADPGKRTLSCFKLNHKRYELRVPAASGGALTHPDFEAMTIEVDVLWVALGPVS